jgi:hypothetical protein
MKEVKITGVAFGVSRGHVHAAEQLYQRHAGVWLDNSSPEQLVDIEKR